MLMLVGEGECVWYDVPLGSSRIDEAADLCVLPMSSWRWRKQPWPPRSPYSRSLTLPVRCIICDAVSGFNYYSYHYLILFRPSPLKQLHLIFPFVSLWPSSPPPGPSLSSPFLLNLNFSLFLALLLLSLSSLVVVSLRGTVLLLTICYMEQREGEGKPVGDRRALLLSPGALREIWPLFHISLSVCVGFLSWQHVQSFP